MCGIQFITLYGVLRTGKSDIDGDNTKEQLLD